MNNPNFSISFGKSRINDYTPHQVKVMREIKKAAIENQWIDIYTGDTLSKENMPTIEHIIAHSLKKSDWIKKLLKQGFQIDGLDNIFPAGSLGNSDNSNKKFVKRIVEDPKILDRLLIEFDKYKQYNSDLIDGKMWAVKLRTTLSKEITGLCSDIKTRALKIQI